MRPSIRTTDDEPVSYAYKVNAKRRPGDDNNNNDGWMRT
jgi:hypothetical protein